MYSNSLVRVVLVKGVCCSAVRKRKGPVSIRDRCLAGSSMVMAERSHSRIFMKVNSSWERDMEMAE